MSDWCICACPFPYVGASVQARVCTCMCMGASVLLECPHGPRVQGCYVAGCALCVSAVHVELGGTMCAVSH